jgi:putative hydrolase of the HAD superfamily
MPVIRAVLFDYGLVLSGPPDPVAWERMCWLLDADDVRFYAAYWRPRHDYDRGALNGAGFWRAVARELGRSLRVKEIAALLEADIELWTQPNQTMIDWAAALQRASVRTGILSNIGDAMEDGVRLRCPWIADFAHHTFSHRLQMVKPEAEIYRHAIEGVEVPAGQVLFVDDRLENVEAARTEGLHAIQYVDHASFVKAMREGGFEGLPSPEGL